MTMWAGLQRAFFLTVYLFAFSAPAASAGLGVLVVARDRGTVGNQELAAAVADLDPDYPVELLLVGPDRQGIENGYAGYIAAARNALARDGVDKVLGIPLFMSAADAVLTQFRSRIEAAMTPATMTWAPALGESYLASEILLDRIRAAQKPQPAQRLVLLLSGAGNAAGAARIKSLGKALLDDIRPLVRFHRMDIAVTYSDTAPEADRARAAAQTAGLIGRSAAKGGTIVVPLVIGVKFTPHMSLEASFARRYGGDHITITNSVMPHPAVRTWLRRMINEAAPATDKTIGIIIMPHGATAPYNDSVMAAMPDRIVGRYPTAYAFGMASPFTIGQAVRKLEAAGLRHAVFLRLFSMPHHFREASDYILGRDKKPPAHSYGGIPGRVRTAIHFVALGGYQADPLISGILRDRIMEVSENPSRESVILLSHGAMSDAADAAGRNVVEGNIADVEAMLELPFRDIRAMTLREDWPLKRAEAVREIRTAIETANKDGRAIVISNRLYGSGSYARYLEGLDYTMNGKGLIPHPNFTRWVETTLEDGIGRLKSATGGQWRAAAAEHRH